MKFFKNMDSFVQLRSQLGEFGNALAENVITKDKLQIGRGGVADFYFIAHTSAALIKAMTCAHRLAIPWMVIGRGGRVLVPDHGYGGLIIQNLTNQIAFTPGQSQVIAESGVLIPRLIMESISRDLGGLEFLVGLTGSVGGAIWFNAEQFGLSIDRLIKRITCVFPDGTIECHPASWFKFGHYEHRFRQTIDSVIWLSIIFQLHPARKDELMRRLQFYQSKMSQALPKMAKTHLVIQPLFKTANFQPHELKHYQCRYARLVSPNYNTAYINHCSSNDLRLWIEKIKAETISSSGVILDDLLTYVGQW